ncbi:MULTISPECIES: helix-turn-helix domain-containing protein [Pseudoalteromonas]|uniref:helix-turn-helix domain-containing protein n=1 Tax=Pseudoalteromonas TaxID=53246 RepID=UPI00140B73FC|nr:MULTISPECIES: helix-turn-helix domain-containing protein [unclassified Pseudoalteromonas]MBH0019744.1 hypothetical protein [Pseudoalteromonas sp. SWXJ133]MBH0038209.1 hypothetical protein [Pseudoalteromonas sp. SWN166]
MSNLYNLKQQVLTLLKEIERIESLQSSDSETFPLSELKQRVHQYCKENGITIDTFCELATISKATLYKAYNSPKSAKRSTIESILSVLGDYQLLVARCNGN